MANQENISEQNAASTTQVRGQDLKSKMIESAQEGEEFRARNQGRDQKEGQTDPESKNPSPEESGE